MKHLTTPILMFTAALIPYPKNGQAQDQASVLSAYFLKVREGHRAVLPADEFRSNEPYAMFTSLARYLNDSVSSVRSGAYEIVHHVGTHSARPEIRRRAVDLLASGYDTGHPQVNDEILDKLTHYAADDFTVLARDSIRRLIRARPMHFDRILKLAGFLNLRDMRNEIMQSTQAGNTSQVRWAAWQALARMGHVTATAEILNRIRELPLNDDVVYQVFPDLIYTRQPAIIAYVVNALQISGDNCFSADAERPGSISCGFRIMEQLAPIIEDFPFSLEENGDLAADDYPEALKTVRAWFSRNKTYTILTHHY